VAVKAWHLQRRTFLRGTGVSLALPFMNAMAVEIPSIALKEILMSDVLTFRVQFSHLIGSVIGVSIFTAVVATWPAIKAARVLPVVAMRGTSS
jgi:ABC-type lipoprotein release transport system permease subunit